MSLSSGNESDVMKKNILLLVFQIGFVCLYCQNEYNIWLGGYWKSYMMEFNDRDVSIDSVGNNAGIYEAGSVICDPKTGELVLIANHEAIYNSDLEIIENGDNIFGSNSTSQGTLILPHPCQCNKYYIIYNDVANFEIPGVEYEKDLFYSLVDMNENDGQGAVIEKNRLIAENMAEGMVAVPNDKSGYWLITHELSSNKYVIHGIDHEGVKPFHSSFYTSNYINQVGRGSFSASKAGDFIAYCESYSGSFIELLQFRQDIGEIVQSNTLTTKLNNNIEFSPYSIELSPNNSRLYATSKELLVQYDLLLDEHKILFDSDTSDVIRGFNSLQLGPDDRIYVNQYAWDYPEEKDSSCVQVHGLIEDPDSLFLRCNYDPYRFELPFCMPGGLQYSRVYKYAYTSEYEEIDKRSPLSLDFSYEIRNDTVLFYSEITTDSITSIRWSFGDGSYSEEMNPVKIYNDLGIYKVSLRASNYYGCRSEVSDTVVIESISKPIKFNIFPNPAYRSFTIESPETIKRIEIFSSDGRKVFSEKSFGPNSEVQKINTDQLTAGIYTVVVESQVDRKAEKIILVR